VYLPEDRGSMTVVDVLAAPAGPERDAAIDEWCRSVWNAFGANRQTILAPPAGTSDQWVLTPSGMAEIRDSAASAYRPSDLEFEGDEPTRS